MKTLLLTLLFSTFATLSLAMPTHQCYGMSGCVPSPLNSGQTKITQVTLDPAPLFPSPGCNDPIGCHTNLNAVGKAENVSSNSSQKVGQSIQNLEPGAGNTSLMNTVGVQDVTVFQSN